MMLIKLKFTEFENCYIFIYCTFRMVVTCSKNLSFFFNVCVCVFVRGGGGMYVHYEKSLSISFPDNAIYFPQAVKNVIIKRRLVLSENK